MEKRFLGVPAGFRDLLFEESRRRRKVEETLALRTDEPNAHHPGAHGRSKAQPPVSQGQLLPKIIRGVCQRLIDNHR